MDSCLYMMKEWIVEKKAGSIIVVATEQPLNVIIQRPDGELIHVGGRADQVVRVNGQLWGRDFKTTSKALEWYDTRNDPNEQFTRYTFMEGQVNGERLQGQLIYVLHNSAPAKTARAKKDCGPVSKTFSVSFTKWQLDEWERDQIFWDDMLRKARENDHYPKSYNNCGWCSFREVCRSANERSIEVKLKSNFTHRIWDHQNPDD